MRLISESVVQMQLSDLQSNRVHRCPPIMTPRASGVHLSGILRFIAIQTGYLKLGVESTRADFEDDFPLIMMMGMFFEEGMASMYPDMIWQPGEMTRDGISGNMDGLSEYEGEPIIDEFKFTKKSSRYPVTEQWMWIQQGLGYCNLYQLARLVRFNVLHINGNYKERDPVLRRSIVEFTERDLQLGWAMLLKYRDNPGVVHE